MENLSCGCTGAAKAGFIPKHLYLGEIARADRHLADIIIYPIMRKGPYSHTVNLLFFS